MQAVCLPWDCHATAAWWACCPCMSLRSMYRAQRLRRQMPITATTAALSKMQKLQTASFINNCIRRKSGSSGVAAWLGGNGGAHKNKVTLHWARLVLGWVTVVGFNSRCGTFPSVCDQPPKSTQPGHPFVGRRNEYQPKGGDTLRQVSKSRYSSCVRGRQ